MSLYEYIDESVAELTDAGVMPGITDPDAVISLKEARRQTRAHLALRFAQIVLPVVIEYRPTSFTSEDLADTAYAIATRLAERFVPVAQVELDAQG